MRSFNSEHTVSLELLMMDNCAIQSLSNSIKPSLTVEDCKKLVDQLYGFKVRDVEELQGYDDRNFKIMADEHYENKNVKSICKDGYVLKVLNSMDSKELEYIEAQNELMLHLGQFHV